MIPQEALQLLHQLVESIKLTGPERDKVREAAKTLQAFIKDVQERDAAQRENPHPRNK